MGQAQEHSPRIAVAMVAVIGLAALLMLAGASGSQSTQGGVPIFIICGVVAFIIQWLVFLPSFLARTERYYDLTGSLTYLTVVFIALPVKPDARSWLLAGMVSIWAVRLGGFLFSRIRDMGHDRRFASLKHSFPRFLLTWTLQGLWVFLTAGAALAAITSSGSTPLYGWAWFGVALWLAGFAIETVADEQKRRFRRDPANQGRFITTGLWAWSRHPNYFGEILLWTGVAWVAAPALVSWQHLTLISPLFVYVLLTRVSGIPLLEREAKKRWGEEPAYRAYVANTPVLVPRFRSAHHH